VRRPALRLAVPEPSDAPAPRHGSIIPNESSTWAAIMYWLRYKGFWFQAVSRVLFFNGLVGLLLWAIDQLTDRHNPTLLLIRGELPLTLFVAALVALAYAVGRLAVHLDPQQPFHNAPALVLIVMVIVGVTSIAGPAFVAIGEAALLVLLLLVLRLRHWDGNHYLVIRAVLIMSSLILLGGIGAGIATGQLLEVRVSVEAADGLVRLVIFLLGVSLYFVEERRYWWTNPPTPVIVEQLHRACRGNDFGRISRWLGEGLVFAQTDQRLLAELILPRRIIVDGDVAIVPSAGGDLILFRVRNGQVAEMRRYSPD